MHGRGEPRTAVLKLPDDLAAQVRGALLEDLGGDLGDGDVSARLIDVARPGRATIITREPMILCGRPWAEATFDLLDANVRMDWRAQDGDLLPAQATLFEIEGNARALLTGERTALNFLQLLSGTATLTRAYVAAVAGTDCQILDTRKTLPGLRTAQKYAVRCGGGSNHRMGLYDMVLIKENHIAAAGSIGAAIAAARRMAPGVAIEVEVETLDEFRAALELRPTAIMLDEFTHAQMAHAVEMNLAAGKPVKLEASGGVDMNSVRAIAETGVDYISIGSLTKHVRAIDLSMRFQLG
ncbi:MAG: carboxylating nicotinate-nucleotide diphosphorylase [Steroidobacteraceae bacterium]